MPLSHICVCRWLPLLALLAVVNLSAGAVLVTHSERARDLRTIRRWTHAWLFEGRNLYAPPALRTDYPPHAIVALSPISLLPASFAAPVWAGINLVLAVLAPVLATRFVHPRASRVETMCVMLLFLCWSGTRSLLQFTLLSLVGGLAALVTADRRPVWSGVGLGLALMKPQVGLPFLAWILFTRRWKVAAIAGAVIAAGSLLWCARAGVNPFSTAVAYTEILALLYSGAKARVGVSHLRPFIAELVPGSVTDLTVAVLGLAILSAVFVEGFRYGARRPASFYPAPGLIAVWSLLTFYYLTYGFVILLPLMALLLLDDNAKTYRFRVAIVVGMQVCLMTDLPGLWRRFGTQTTDSPLVFSATHFHRLWLSALLAAVWILHRRTVGKPPEVHDNSVT